MSYSATRRDRYRIAVAAVTGTVAAAAMGATGWLGGAAAADHAQGADQATSDSGSVPRQRPTKTRVTTRYVTGSGSTSTLGGGGTVSQPTTPAPVPAPARAPSNGS